ncbi:MAG: relaxase domain-containing protein, partial [Acidimicrobiales bacterium]
AIYGLSGALSAIYDYHRDKALARQLGVTFVVNERTGVREIAGVPSSLNELWSTRRAQITPRVEQLKAQYLTDHGRPPSLELVSRMAQWATLDTRPAKSGPESTEQLFARWSAAARAVLRSDLAAVWQAATGHGPIPTAPAQTDAEIVEAVIGRLEAEKATWTESNVVQVTWQTMDRDRIPPSKKTRPAPSGSSPRSSATTRSSSSPPPSPLTYPAPWSEPTAKRSTRCI